MEIKLNIKKGKFNEQLIREIARQILTNDKNKMNFGWNTPVDEIMRKKAMKLLKEDKEFDKELTEDVKKQLKSKSLIRNIAKSQIKDKMRHYDD